MTHFMDRTHSLHMLLSYNDENIEAFIKEVK